VSRHFGGNGRGNRRVEMGAGETAATGGTARLSRPPAGLRLRARSFDEAYNSGRSEFEQAWMLSYTCVDLFRLSRSPVFPAIQVPFLNFLADLFCVRGMRL